MPTLETGSTSEPLSRPNASAPTSAATKDLFLGIGLLRLELILLGVAAAVSVLFLVLGQAPSIAPTLVFTLMVGNLTAFAIDQIASRLYQLSPVRSWLLYLAVLIPAGAIGSLLASLTLLALFRYPVHPIRFFLSNMGFGTLVSVVTGVSIYSVISTRTHWERRNRLLEEEVAVGAVRLNAQEADLKAAHEIQAHLLPGELPTLPGMEIACAWQPAQSVGGDYFDAFPISATETALCMADVSGKGISAALLMANLQAATRAFAPQERGPAALCTRLNETLCGSIAAGKFVTFFYAVVEPASRMLRYENAGHCTPILLRDGNALPLEGGGMVLGLFSSAVYADRMLELHGGDCLLLVTDGVTEAMRPDEEEFGEQRVIDAATGALAGGAHAVRTRILEEVTAFCGGNFHDDASLMVLMVR